MILTHGIFPLCKRQKPIGHYIVDFYCVKAALVIEVDGGQHYSDEGLARDRVRDHDLAAMQIQVLRFDNDMVLRNPDAVMAVIQHAVLEPESPRPPLLQRGDNK